MMESIQYYNDEKIKALQHDINKSAPSDNIRLSWREDKRICEFWHQSDKDKYFIPSDLFFAQTIPIMDCDIEVDERGKPDDPDGIICPFRVTVFSDYQERIISAPDGYRPFLGAITLKLPSGMIFIPLAIIPGENSVPICLEIGVLYKGKHAIKANIPIKELVHMQYAALATWYGIQIALLHPTLKEIFNHPTEERRYTWEPNKQKKKKRITRYIRKHVITLKDIDNALPTRPINRKTLAWYVIGHWRHYKNGEKVFIRGYWKGELRQMKKNLDEGRDRLVAIPN